MLFDASKPTDITKAKTRFNYLIEKGKRFEITVKHPIRSLSQNAYLHLILSWFALQYGDTLEYVKLEIFKKLVNREIFEYEFANRATGEIRLEYRSTAKLPTDKLTMAIERFRNYSAMECGWYLPEPSDLVHLQEIEDEVKKHHNQLYL